MALILTFDFSGGNQVPLNAGAPLTKTATNITGELSLVSNQVLPRVAGVDSWYYDATNTYTNNQYVRWTVGTVGGKDFGGLLQTKSDGTGYYVTAGATGGNIDLYKVVAGSFSQLTSVAAQTYALSDDFYLDIGIGGAGVIRLYRGNDPTGTLVFSVTDGTPLTGGKPGMAAYDGTGAFSAWLAGDDSAGGATVTPGAGALALTGLAPTVITPIFAQPPAGTLTLAGQEPQLATPIIGVGWTDPNDTWSYVGGRALVGGSQPSFVLGFVPGVASLLLSGLAPTVVVAAGGGGTTVTPGVGALVLAGLAPTLLQDSVRAPGAGALTLAGLAPTVTQNVIVQPGAGALTFAGQQPAVLNGASVVAQPGAGALTLSGLAPALLQTTNATPQPGAGALVLAGLAPAATVSDNRAVLPAAGTLTLSGLAPTVLATAGAAVNPITGVLTLTGLAPTAAVSDNHLVQPGTGALTLVGLAPAVPVPSPTVSPDPGALSLEGLAPEILVSGGDTVLSAKYLGRPNVVIHGLRKKRKEPEPPLPAEITNMPDAAPVRRGRGLDRSLLDVVARAPSPPAASVPVVPEIRVISAPPAAAEALPARPEPVISAPASPAAPPKPPPPAPKTVDPHTVEVQALREQMALAQEGIDTLLTEMAALRDQVESQRAARDLKERNLQRAKQIAERLLEDMRK